jgi:hypothetical protein
MVRNLHAAYVKDGNGYIIELPIHHVDSSKAAGDLLFEHIERDILENIDEMALSK